MYILFINSGGKHDIFFSAEFNNNSNKKNCPTHGFSPTQPNPYGLGWTHVFNPTQPNPTHVDWTNVMG